MHMALSMSLMMAVALAQAEPPQHGVDPLELVRQAETLCASPEKEEAILMLWDALERLAPHADQPANAAGVSAALALLQANDPLHAERVSACTAVARAHANLALVYRGKKWFTVASDCLDVAERFDRAASAKERANLVAARPKDLSTPPIPEPDDGSLLRRKAALRVHGPWREVGDELECGPHPANTPWYEWVLHGGERDCELSIEFRSADPKAAHDCGLLVGLDRNTAFYQVIAAYYPEQGNFELSVFAYEGEKGSLLASKWIGPVPTPDGFRRLTFRVQGNSLHAQLDSAPPLEVKTSIVPRGRFGITVGLDNQASAAVRLRNLRCGPWPPLTEQAIRDQAIDATQKRCTKALNDAQVLLNRKEPEAATLTLRGALRDAEQLPPGVLRASLTKSIQGLLPRADLLHARRSKVEQEGARALLALADRYIAAGQPRAGCRLAVIAASLDADASGAKLDAARRAVGEWNKARTGR